MKLPELQARISENFPSVTKDESTRIIAFSLNIPRLELYAHAERTLTKAELASIDAMLAEREEGKPLQYIFKEAHFRNLTLNVGLGVLIPRPETEMLVDLALERIEEPDAGVCDLGTGSGAVALALAQEMPDLIVTGVDSSREALSYAERNKVRNKIGNVIFLYGDLFSPFSNSLAASGGEPREFSLVVANLPYVSHALYDELPREIRDYEPPEALLGGEDGLDVIRLAAESAPTHLRPGGHVIFEFSPEQTRDITAVLESCNLVDIEIVRDLNGCDRFAIARKPCGR